MFKVYIGFNLLENRGLSYYYFFVNKVFDYLQVGVFVIYMVFLEYEVLYWVYFGFLLFDKLEFVVFFNIFNWILQDEVLYNQFWEVCWIVVVELIWEWEEEWLLKVYRLVVRSDF